MNTKNMKKWCIVLSTFALLFGGGCLGEEEKDQPLPDSGKIVGDGFQPSTCGNGVCEQEGAYNEDCKNCEKDCGKCTTPDMGVPKPDMPKADLSKVDSVQYKDGVVVPDAGKPDMKVADSKIVDGCVAGTEKCPCWVDNWCAKGLVCLSGLCVKPMDAGLPDQGKPDQKPTPDTKPVPDTKPTPDMATKPDGCVPGTESCKCYMGNLCTTGLKCLSGVCVKMPDSGVPPDKGAPDKPKPDLPKPDMSKPDLSKPDLPKPDAAKPDLPKPDMPKPDAPKPDAATHPYCGDGKCGLDENCQVCPKDCGYCGDVCGDGKCGKSEGCSGCPQDCGQCPWCGDQKCNGTETCKTCPADCYACPDAAVVPDKPKPDLPKPDTVTATCGDGKCNGVEDCLACSKDCGAVKTIKVKTGWTLWGVVGPVDTTVCTDGGSAPCKKGWPMGVWKEYGTSLSWCPSMPSMATAMFNAANSPSTQAQTWGLGGSSWTDPTKKNDAGVYGTGWCNGKVEDATMYLTGYGPVDMGCQAACSPSLFFNYKCSAPF